MAFGNDFRPFVRPLCRSGNKGGGIRKTKKKNLKLNEREKREEKIQNKSTP